MNDRIDDARRSPSGPRLLDYEQVEQEYGIGRRTMRALRERGELPIVKVGSRVFFKRTDLDRYVEAHTVDCERGHRVA